MDLGRKLTSGSDCLQLQRATGSGFRPGERVEIVSAGLVPAPAHIAEALGLDEGAQVVRRQRRYLDDEGVITLSTSWLPGELAESAPALAVPEALPKMTFGLIEERTGRRAVRRRDVVCVQPVPEGAAALLHVEAGTLALTMSNYYWDQHGSVTEYATDFMGAGRQLTAEYDLNQPVPESLLQVSLPRSRRLARLGRFLWITLTCRDDRGHATRGLSSRSAAAAQSCRLPLLPSPDPARPRRFRDLCRVRMGGRRPGR